MILSNESVETAIQKGDLIIDPFNPEMLKRASYTFTLGSSYLEQEGSGLTDLRKGDPTFIEKALGEEYIFEPGTFRVFLTDEKIALPGDIACFLSTRGHIAQLGIDFLQTSIFCEPEKAVHQIKLEARNVGSRSVLLKPGMPIVKGIFLKVV